MTKPHPKEAWKTVIWESQEPYSLVHHNCCDVTYEIVRTYGCTELLDPAKEAIPNDWYDALPGVSSPISTSAAIAICLHKQSQREIAIREVPLVIPSRIRGSPLPWRTARWRPWEELSLVWEMMIGHLLSLWTATMKRFAPHRRSNRRS